MKHFSFEIAEKQVNCDFPTNLNEITSEYLNTVTKSVNIAPFHALVAIVYRASLLEIVALQKKNTRQLSTTIVPLFVRGNVPSEASEETKELFAKMKTSDKIIIANTDIERGYRIAAPKNLITMEYAIYLYNNSKDLAKQVIGDKNHYYFVDFKLVSLSDIKGFYDETNKDEEWVNPFITFGKE